MRTPVWTGPAFILLTVFIYASPAAAQMQPASVITMSGHGEVRATPDTAMLSAGVSTEAPTAAAALAANNSRMQTVMTALKKLGIPDKDIQTSNFSVSPQYANCQQRCAPPHRLSGQQPGRGAAGRCRQAGHGAGCAGHGRRQSDEWRQFLDPNDAALLSQARAAAVAEARAKAETYAKAAGVSLGAILSISEEGSQGPRPLYAMQAPVAMAKIVPVAMGEQSVSADVTIVWEIK